MTAAALQVPADPRMGVTLRAFATAVVSDLGAPADQADNLALAVSELLASAVEGGSQRLRIELIADAERWTLRADGIGDIGSEPADLPYRRVDLLMGLFPTISVDEAKATFSSATSV
ncbi:MAG: ATP-binding protein [Actinobacteria bacterium]|nr:MAG: ATP-binding protein [Actinomycetota bacterium]